MVAVFAAGMLVVSAVSQSNAPASEPVAIDATAGGTPFPHYWEQMFGSGRAILSLRDGYRRDLRTVKQATGFTYVRFHGIFMDEVGLYDVDAASKPVYNFSYIDQIYDGLLENGVKPYVELSFMPKKQAPDPPTLHFFWYHQVISPPKDYAIWDAMIDAFTRHLVERYGIDEVSQWYFEVWNEPNIDFWDGDPKLATYLKFYDHTARAVKNVDARLRVGGPSTARTAWAPEFLAYCKQHHLPVDFVSTHVYGTDKPQDVFGTDTPVAQDRFVCKAVSRVHDQIKASAYPEVPLIISEFNADWDTHTNVTDSAYMGPWMATTISQCDGLTKMMSYWSFSDVFEEQGVVKKPFYGGYGLMAVDNIPKPALNAFAMLHQLGDVRLKSDADSTLVTRRKDGTLVVALWNYAPPTDGPLTGATKSFTLQLTHAGTHATILRLDAAHGDVNAADAAMGRPDFPSRKQIAELQQAGRAAPPELQTIQQGRLTLTVPPQGLVVVEIQ
jgi:xylan 1,4-beta-xylosidase